MCDQNNLKTNISQISNLKNLCVTKVNDQSITNLKLKNHGVI